MSIIIQTGFEAIGNDISFQPQTQQKGKLLVMADHVRDVKEYRKSGESYLITARVIRQTSVTLTPYETSLHINRERFVNKVSCTCVYNQSGKCKHVAALIYFINNVESQSKTSYEQQWGKPSARQFAKDKYAKGKDFAQMYPKKNNNNENLEICPLPVDLSELKEESALKSVIIAERTSKDVFAIKNLLSSLVTEVELNLEKEDCFQCLKTFFIFAEEFLVYKHGFKLEKQIEDFYNNNIVIDDENNLKLCCQTLNQSQCQKWYEARRLRLSASSKIHQIKVRCRKTIDSLINDFLHPKKIDCRATKYGLSQEKYAKEKYQTLNSCLVKKVGVIICRTQPWLCASVDGVVIEDGCITKLLEIKCPIMCKEKPVVDRERELCNVKYLYFENGDVELKKKHPYYTQVQVQLYVTGMITCDLFVHSPIDNGSCTVTIHRDEEFLKDVILASEKFYFNYYLHAAFLECNGKSHENRENSDAM